MMAAGEPDRRSGDADDDLGNCALIGLAAGLIAFECWTTGDVYVMNDDGTSRTKLKHNRLIERTLDWQPVAAL